MNRKAITKMQAILLGFIIVVAAAGGSVAYILWSSTAQSAETIKIGVVGDLDMVRGKSVWEGIVLAAEQINAEGGVLGRKVEVIGEDSDGETGAFDVSMGTVALTRLITYHKVDFIITSDAGFYLLPYQDIVYEHKKILLGVMAADDELTQRVIDNYEKYKYYFRVWTPNMTSAVDGWVDSLLTLRNYTGFNKVAYIMPDVPALSTFTADLDYFLPEVYGFDLVYKAKFPPTTIDFTSYFATVEASGAEILFCLITTEAGIPLVQEWYDRQSPFVLWGMISAAGQIDSWNLTDGKCAHVVVSGGPVTAGYPLTTKTVPLRNAYIDRWGKIPTNQAPYAYDAVRFILYDALKRAGTTETDAVIEALEKTDIETSGARRFVFTSSHDVMVGAAGPNRPGEDYVLVTLFQWQNGAMVPVYPQQIMEEAGVTYTYPDWPGPWHNIS